MRCVLAAALFVISILSTTPTAYAATGWITASPGHHVVPPGEARTSTIRWDASGIDTAQVYVSRNGEPGTLFAQMPRGEQDADWIQSPGYYVFRLYAGAARTTLLAWTSVTTHQPPASRFGFNYWPEGYSCDVLNNVNWTAQRTVVERDLDHIASLSGGVVRIMFWPQKSGYLLRDAMQGGFFTADFSEQTTNVVQLLRLAHERGIKVIVAFGNNYFDAGDGTPGHRWWRNSYADFSLFLADSVKWVNGFVDAIEQSPYRDAVIYYDYENEYYRDHPHAGWYITVLYDWSHVPPGKRGVSVLHVPNDVDDLKYQLGVGSTRDGVARRLDYVDFHSYPGLPHNADIEGSYDFVRLAFPDSTVLLGEMGHGASDYAAEATQQQIVLNVVERAIAKGIPYYLNWMLWDRTPGSDPSGTAWGYGKHRPKDVLGGVGARLGLLRNGDMEAHQGDSCWQCATPLAWEGGGSVPFVFFGGGPWDVDAATNSWYARLQALSHPGTVWISSALTPVRGGGRLFVNGFIRSSMDSVRLNVVEYDAQMRRIRDNPGPGYTPSGWAFVNYLQQAGAWSVALLPGTRYIIVSVSAETRMIDSILDIDTFSAWQVP